MQALETRIPPLVLTLLAGATTWLLSRVDAPVGFLDNGPSQLAAIGLWLIGAGVLLEAVGGFVKARTSVDPHHPSKATELVNTGMYRFTRNPMYLGMVLVVIGGALWLATLFGLIGPALLVLALTRLQIMPEERHLEEAFGDAYDTFRAATRRWI